jgi:ATP-binding cassette subfamily F protein 3
MLTLSKVSKAFAGRTLFSDVSLQVNREDRIGLVGPNGAGKSTLFSLILREATPDDGQIIMEKNATFGFLPQETAPAGDETVLELACAISPEMAKAQQAIKRHEAAGTFDEEEYHDALGTFSELGGWQLEPKAKQILKGLAFREADFDREARTMSGGWIMRAHLARLLVMEPDLLLLDEPTNHLDLESLYWFQDYLQSYPGAILMISHDREFLNALVDSILEISHQKLNRYRGNWDKYVVEKVQREEIQLAAYKNQQKEVAPGIRRPLSRQGQQSVAGAEQAEADRPDGENRGAAEPGKDGPHALPAAAALGHPLDHAEGHGFFLRRSRGLSRAGV